MDIDMTTITQFVPGVPHPNTQCTKCAFIDVESLTVDEIMRAVVDDAEHWGVDWAEDKLGIYGVHGMLSANKVLTGKAVGRTLVDVNNPAGLFVTVARRYKDQTDGLRQSLRR